jgi:hypothetical protein
VHLNMITSNWRIVQHFPIFISKPTQIHLNRCYKTTYVTIGYSILSTKIAILERADFWQIFSLSSRSSGSPSSQFLRPEFPFWYPLDSLAFQNAK